MEVTGIAKALAGLACLFAAKVGPVYSQSFQKTYDTGANERAYCVQQTYDGGFILAGQSSGTNPNFYFDAYLAKVNGNGDLSWTSAFGTGTFSLELRYVQQTGDSGYIACGKIENIGLLVRTDASGNLIWSRSLGGFTFITANEVHETSDGGFIVIGSASDLAGPGHLFLARTDGNGNLTWQKILSSGGGNYDDGLSVKQTGDGGFILTGSIILPGVSSSLLLAKADSIGNILWNKTIRGTNTYNIGHSVEQTSDGGYIVSGQTYTMDYDAYLVKTNAGGDTLWTRAYGGSSQDYGLAVQQTADGGYVVGGYTRSFGVGLNDGYLLKTDSLGGLSWSHAYGGPSYDPGFFARQTVDGGYVLAGQSNSFGTGSADVILTRTDTGGNSGCNDMAVASTVYVPDAIVGTAVFAVSGGLTASSQSLTPGSGGTMKTLCFSSGFQEVVPRAGLVTVRPNPFNRSVTVSFELAAKQEVSFRILDMAGRPVSVFAGRKFADGQHTITMETADLDTGIYFLRMDTEDDSVTIKIMRDNP